MAEMLDPAFESALRDLAPRVLGAVIRRCGDFAAAEDAVQDALIAAFRDWPRDGVPENPGGWLYRVALRRLADQRAGESARRDREQTIAAQRAEAIECVEPDELSGASDDALTLLFTCCHPALGEPAAIALTLRAVGGLTTAEIARAFLVPEATMAQRISRAKRNIAASGIPFAPPIERERKERLAAVRHVLYLIFNEGHASSGGAALLRLDLASEAIRLTRALAALEPRDPEVQGLLALMLLGFARRAARTGPAGELVPLDEQDRSRWDRAAIDEGRALVEAAFRRGEIGSYQIQAAIAALHAEASSTGTTDWPQILALYEVLRRIARSPMIELSRAVAAAMVHGPEHGLQLLLELEREASLRTSHRLDAVRAHLLERCGRRDEALERYKAAALRTASLPERQYLLRKAAELRGE